MILPKKDEVKENMKNITAGFNAKVCRNYKQYFYHVLVNT